MDIVSTKMTNAIAINVTSTASINCHNIKVRVCYVLHTILLAMMLLLIIITNCYNYTKQRGINVPAMQNGKEWILKSCIKNRTCYYFDDIINLEDFDIDNISKDEKSHENILISDISYKTLIDQKPLPIRFDKIDGFIKIYDRTRYLTLLGSEKIEGFYNWSRHLISLKSGITYNFLTILQKSKLIFIMILGL